MLSMFLAFSIWVQSCKMIKSPKNEECPLLAGWHALHTSFTPENFMAGAELLTAHWMLTANALSSANNSFSTPHWKKYKANINLSVPGPALQETGHHFPNLSLQMLHPLGPAPWQSDRHLPQLLTTAGMENNTYKNDSSTQHLHRTS